MMPITDSLLTDRPKSEFEALVEIAKTMAAPVELPELLDAIMQTIIRVLEQADVGAIMLWDQSAGIFRPNTTLGYDLETLKEIDLAEGESITGKVFAEGQARLLYSPQEVLSVMNNMSLSNREVMARSIGNEALPQSAVAAPISAGDFKYGVLVLESLGQDKPFVAENLPFVQTLADLIALAIDRERLKLHADAISAARQSDRMRAEIMAALSHELRMLLASIKGYATALLMDEVNWSKQKRTDFLQRIEEACNDMERMLQDMLDSALIEVSQLSLERQPVRLQHVAREISKEVELHSNLHRLLVDFPSDFPLVEVDPRWIRQVFRNIVDNAVKYSPEGGLIVIRGEVRSLDVVVSIADQGVGISSEDLIPLFEKYFRVHSAATLHVPGSGLGLPIARAIVEAHGGRIWIESQVEEGTTVFFSLPLLQLEDQME